MVTVSKSLSNMVVFQGILYLCWLSVGVCDLGIKMLTGE